MSKHTKIEQDFIVQFQHRYFGAFPSIGRFDKAKVWSPEHAKAGACPSDWVGTPVDNWHNWVRTQIEDFGCITTPLYNRRRFFFGRESDDRTIREAIAYAPQSMTADAIDTGLIALWEWGTRERSYTGRPLINILAQVHDSILFQFPEEEEAEIVPKALELLTIKHTLKQGRPFHVPAEAKIGYNWGDAHEKENPGGLIKWRGPGLDLRSRPNPKASHIEIRKALFAQ